MTHSKFVKRLAERYMEIYGKLGFVAAKEYADRMIKGDDELKKLVKDEVAARIAAASDKKGA